MPREIDVVTQLTALFIAAGPVLLPNCGCPKTEYEYDRTIRLDVNSADQHVQVALAAPVGAELSQNPGLCGALCVTPSNTTGSESVLGCERAEHGGDPAILCHISGRDDCGGVGRVPPGLTPAEQLSSPNGPVDVRGDFLARAARLEAASVHAFLLLAQELRVHGAPAALVSLARRAAYEELGHARAMARLSRRYGVQPSPPIVRQSALRPRSLLTMARDNAVEGCVHETFGALHANWQGRNAADHSVRHCLNHIATEELSHAALSWNIAAWFHSVASPSERRDVRAARDTASDHLASDTAPEPHALLERDLGVPSRTARRHLLGQLRETVWS